MDHKNSSTIRAIDGINDLNSSLEELFSSGTSQATGISAVSRHKSLTQLLYVMASFNGLEDDEEQMKVFVMANMLASLNHMVPKRMFGYITTGGLNDREWGAAYKTMDKIYNLLIKENPLEDWMTEQPYKILDLMTIAYKRYFNRLYKELMKTRDSEDVNRDIIRAFHILY